MTTPPPPSSTPAPEERIRCPYCAEWIMREAILCRYCGNDLVPQAGSGGPTPQRHPPSVAVATRPRSNEGRDLTEQSFPPRGVVRAAPHTSTFAVVSLITGIAAWTVLPIFAAVLAVITAYLAKNEIRGSSGRLTGSGLATAGQVLGYVQIGLVAAASFLLILFLLGPSIGIVSGPTPPQSTPMSIRATALSREEVYVRKVNPYLEFIDDAAGTYGAPMTVQNHGLTFLQEAVSRQIDIKEIIPPDAYAASHAHVVAALDYVVQALQVEGSDTTGTLYEDYRGTAALWSFADDEVNEALQLRPSQP